MEQCGHKHAPTSLKVHEIPIIAENKRMDMDVKVLA